jgi:N-acetylneuraminate lyase
LWTSAEEYGERLVREGVTGVFCCGTSGESMSLTLPERKAALEAWLATPLRVIAHVGTARYGERGSDAALP